jgi:hypothetical protein
MREANVLSLGAGTSTVVITPSHYDKRALTTTDLLALTNSLCNLSYMTSVSAPKVANVLAHDGALELIVRHMLRLSSSTAPMARLAYSAALTSLSNIAISGNQTLRLRLAEAGTISAIIQLLQRVAKVTEQVAQTVDPEQSPMIQEDDLRGAGISPVRPAIPLVENEADEELLSDLLYRVDDMLLAMKIIAYISKYPSVRMDLHCKYSVNVFQLIEIFTTPTNLSDLRRWAVICMRNAFKRDGNSGTLRRCGHLKCGNWETAPRQYSKCSRCRRVTYCRYPLKITHFV